MGRNYEFQQDNAKAFTAKINTRAFKNPIKNIGTAHRI